MKEGLISILQWFWSKLLFLKEFVVRLRKKPLGFIGLVILIFWIFVSVFSPILAPYGPTEFSTNKFSTPVAEHPFGTDRWGRDVLSRVIAGSRTAFILALSATGLGLIGGTLIGITAAYYEGPIGELLGRTMDILMAFPALLIAMFILGVLGPGTFNVILVIGLAHTPRIGRVARSAALEVKEQEFVEAAKVRGESNFYIMFSEILPNILDTLGVEGAIRFAYSIFLSASLGFLGLGVQPPTPDWGLMISESREHLQTAPWLVIFPSIAIASLVLAANFLAEGIEAFSSGDI